MKKLIPCILLTTFYFNSNSQSSNNYPGVYRWTDVVNILPCTIAGHATSQTPVSSQIDQKFTIVNIVYQDAIIKFLNYTTKRGEIKDTANFFAYNFKKKRGIDSLALSRVEKKVHAYEENQLYFKIPIVTLTHHAVRYTRADWSLSAGALNFPFKYRFQKKNSDFSGNFNFGTGVGVFLPHDSAAHFNYSILAGFSISQIHIDSANADINQKELVSTNNFAGFSFSLGVMMQNNKIQIGAFLGWDKLSKATNQHYGWHYQGRPWLSIGLGYTLFSDDKEAKASKSTQ